MIAAHQCSTIHIARSDKAPKARIDSPATASAPFDPVSLFMRDAPFGVTGSGFLGLARLSSPVRGTRSE